MRRDLFNLMIIMLLSTAVAAASNVLGHRIDWIRKPLNHAMTSQTTTTASATTKTTATAPVVDGSPQESEKKVVEEKPANGSSVTTDEVLKHLADGNARFIDAREESDYAAGHLRGAIHLPSSAIFANNERVTSQVALDDCLIVYCGGGGCEASHNVSDALQREYGFTRVLIYDKGWEEITASGLFERWIVTGEQP
jgi:rhodanese-related sulfurtransferase